MRRSGRELAILLPGLNYNTDMPLLYYATEHLYERDIDTLRVDFTYNQDATFLAESDENQLAWLKEDGRAVIDFGVLLGEYERVTITVNRWEPSRWGGRSPTFLRVWCG